MLISTPNRTAIIYSEIAVMTTCTKNVVALYMVVVLTAIFINKTQPNTVVCAGRQYDAFGSAYIWWSNETNAKFQERAQCFVDQYSRFTVTELNKTVSKPSICVHCSGTAVQRPANFQLYVLQVNGQMTLRENIADNGGIREAYRAFKKLKARRGLDVVSPRLPGLERYSPDQIFFIGYATVVYYTENLLYTASFYLCKRHIDCSQQHG